VSLRPPNNLLQGQKIERELASHISQWAIADSVRLLEETERLLKSNRCGKRREEGPFMPDRLGADYWRERAEEASIQSSGNPIRRHRQKHLAGAAQLAEPREDEPNHSLKAQVRIKSQPKVAMPHVAERYRQSQLAPPHLRTSGI
jgi:hypothetical protein